MGLTDKERETYESMWAVNAYSDYSPGEANLPIFLDMVGNMRGTVLDAGCGSGKGALALQQHGFVPTLLDLTPAGLMDDARHLPFIEKPLWSDLHRSVPKHDWVYCCDVLEHIPPTFTMLVVSRLLEVSRRGVFLTISLVQDQFGVWIGTSLHQTIQPFGQWKEQLSTLAPIYECRDLIDTGVFLLIPPVTHD